jgi:hypothetical protein
MLHVLSMVRLVLVAPRRWCGATTALQAVVFFGASATAVTLTALGGAVPVVLAGVATLLAATVMRPGPGSQGPAVGGVPCPLH